MTCSSTFKPLPSFTSTHLSQLNIHNNINNKKKFITNNINYYYCYNHFKSKKIILNEIKEINSKKGSKRPPPRFGDTTAAAGDRLRHLVSDFESLTEPIDRVKRLLDCAARLPPFDESARSPENRVTGCTTQVWLKAEMDEGGRMRFSADSDSEITKGFVWCLIWLLDGAEPAEVAGMKAEDLAVMNVGGMHGKAQSRVNTWHNIFIGMQNRTKAIVEEKKEKQLPPLILSSDAINGSGSFAEAKIKQSRWKQLDANLSSS